MIEAQADGHGSKFAIIIELTERLIGQNIPVK